MSEKQFGDHLCQKCGSDIFQTIKNHIACSSCGLIKGYIIPESDVDRVHLKDWEWDKSIKPTITSVAFTEDKSIGYICKTNQ